MPEETFEIKLSLTQEQINLLGELVFNQGDCGEGEQLYDLIVNAAGETGADLP